jgi:hypothetical protein
MKAGRARHTILHLLFVTAVAALGFATLFNESPWWRASLMTLTLCLVLKALIAAVICRGARQAFSLGFVISTVFFLLSLYTLAGVETLPYLLTQLVWEHVVIRATTPPSSEHFYMVSVILWGLGCAYSGGLLSVRWYSHRVAQTNVLAK